MNSYKFIMKQQKGEKCRQIPRDVIEREYGLPEEEVYVFFIYDDRSTKNVVYLEDHPKYQKILPAAGLANHWKKAKCREC